MALKPTVGLDIGTQQMKAVEIRPERGRLTITALGIAPTPVGVMQNNIITDPQLMGKAIRQMLKDSGITAKRVVSSVAGQSAVVIRIIEVPKMTDAELKETMRWEVERHVPFAPSETVLDYQPLPPADAAAAASPNMEVLLAVAQQDIVNNLVETLFAAGLDPVAIDIEPLAAARAALDLVNGQPVVRPVGLPMMASQPGEFTGELPQDSYPETVALVNIGATNTDISIFQNGQLVFPRSLPLAGDSLTRAIADQEGYALDQAERIKREYAAIQIDKMAVYTGNYYDDPNAPQFGEDVPFAGRAPSSRLRNPQFTDQDNPFDFTGEGPQFDDLDRTQPMASSTLNLAARPQQPGEALPSQGADFGGGGLGAADDSGLRDKAFQAIAPVLSELSTELRRSLDYYRSRAQGRSVDRVLLTGGTALLGNLASFLQSELQVPVAVADALGGLEVRSRQFDPSYLGSIAPIFAVAIGLAARDAVFEANPQPKKAAEPKSSGGKKSRTTAGQPDGVTIPPAS